MTSISFSITPEVLALVYSPRERQLVIPVVLGLFLVMIGVGMVLTDGPPLYSGVCLGVGAAVVSWLARSFLIGRKSFRKLGNEPGGRLIFERQTLTLLDDGIWIHFESGRKMFVPWKDFFVQIVAEGGTALKFTPVNFVWIPENAFAAEARDFLQLRLKQIPAYHLRGFNVPR